MTALSRFFAVCALGLALGIPANAESTAIAQFKDWTVFKNTSGGETICFAATQATDKAPKSVSHGDVWFYVTNWQSGRARNQPSMKVGYDLREDRPTSAKIGRSSFSMFGVGREAFADDSDDARLVRALKKGSELRVEAVSEKNTQTAYYFSLSGSSAAIEKAAYSCR